MSPPSEIVSWLILAAVAYAVFQHIKKKRAEAAEAEELRAGLRARGEECRKAAAASALKDQYFSLAASDKEQTTEEIEDHQRKARAAEQEGHALMLAAVTLDAVVKQPTKAKMIAVMQHYVLDFGQRAAQTAAPNMQDTFLVTFLNGILAEIKRQGEGPSGYTNV